MTQALHTREQLDRALLAQLQFEHAAICRQRRVPLAVPLFELTDSGKILGSYDRENRILRFSRDLIQNYPWAVTLQVLRHEMAHQLCGESEKLLPAPHGDAFLAACEIMGVEPPFQQARVVDRALLVAANAAEDQTTEEGRRCLARVEKLLALAGSGNQHEAALAMQKANELLEKNHLQALLARRNRCYVKKTIELHRKRLSAPVRKICSILHDFFHVRLVVAELFSPVDGESYKVIDMYGSAENVAIAEYCCHFLMERLDRFWAQQKSDFGGKTGKEKKSFCLGVLTGFAERLAGQQRQTGQNRQHEEISALVVAEDRRLENYVASRYERLTRSRSRATQVYQDSFTSGRKAGRQLTLSRSVTDGANGGGRLLGYQDTRKNRK